MLELTGLYSRRNVLQASPTASRQHSPLSTRRGLDRMWWAAWCWLETWRIKLPSSSTTWPIPVSPSARAFSHAPPSPRPRTIHLTASAGGTLAKAAATLKEHKAKEVIAIVTHGILSGNAIETINRSCLSKVIVTNTVPLSDKLERCPKLRVIDVSGTLAEAIRRTFVSLSLPFNTLNVP